MQLTRPAEVTRRRPQLMLPAAAVVVTAVVMAGCGVARGGVGRPAVAVSGGNTRQLPSPRREVAASVDHVVDGDTLDARVAGRLARVRTVQVDAPESSSTRFGRPDRCGAPAKAFAETLARPGDTVWLEFSGRDHEDRYGRVLALVHLGRPGGETWQERIVRAGWAEVLVYRGNRTRLLGALQADQIYARMHQLGVYGRCAGRFHDGGG